MKLTDREKAMLRKYGFGNNYNEDDPTQPTWTWTVSETKQDRGVLGSLVKKGLCHVSGRSGSDDSDTHLTDAGLAIFLELFPDHYLATKQANERMTLE